MFQKFYTDTLGSRFIKSLLAQTPIPIFDCVTDGDHLVEGRYYVYKRFIIQCFSSGVLAVSSTEELYPSNTIFPSVFVYTGTGVKGATFYVRGYCNDYSVKTHSTFKSSTNYYDPETHYHLGRYLRYINTTEGLNLFSYYNVYNSKYFSDVELYTSSAKTVDIARVSSTKYKVVAVPIRFGHTYSVYLDCPVQVLFRACIHDDSGFVSEDELPVSYKEQSENITQLPETLQNSGKIYSNLRFDTPVKYRVETSSPSAMSLQHNLYLLIQLPLNNDSSIVVLENYNSPRGIRCDENSVQLVSNNINPSLLRLNTKQSYAFSDRLMEYLLGNVIHSKDPIFNDIAQVQTALSSRFLSYRNSFIRKQNKKGVWDNDISRLVQELLSDERYIENSFDQDGNINVDVEKVLYFNGGNN